MYVLYSSLFLISGADAFTIEQYEATVLNIHLKQPQYGWFAVPSILLLILLPLSYFLFSDHSGFLDLADPVTAATLGVSSPENVTLSPFASGKEDGRRRIRLGVLKSRRTMSEAEEERLALLVVNEDEAKEAEKWEMHQVGAAV
jgi:hypothetical protein